MKKYTLFLFVAAVAILFTSCADVSHVQACLPETEHTYGFWGGLWHGIVAGFAFIGSLFDKDIAVWAVNNNGGWYTFGFVLGCGSFGSVIKIVTSSRRHES